MNLDSLLKRHKAKTGKKKKRSDVRDLPLVSETAPIIDVTSVEEPGVLVESSSLVSVPREKCARSSAHVASKKKRKVNKIVEVSVAAEKGLFIQGEANLPEYPVPCFGMVDLVSLAFPVKKLCFNEQGYIKRLYAVNLSTNFDQLNQWLRVIQTDVERRLLCNEEDLVKRDMEIRKLSHQLRILGNTVGDPVLVEKFKKRSAELHEELQVTKGTVKVLKKERDDLKASMDAVSLRVKELEVSEEHSRELLQIKQASIDKLEEDFLILREEQSITKQELDNIKARSDQDVALQWLQHPKGLEYLCSEWVKTEPCASFLSSLAKACLQTPKGTSILKDKCFSYFRKGMVAGINQSVSCSAAHPGVPLEKFEPSMINADWGLSKEEMVVEESDTKDEDTEDVANEDETMATTTT